MQVLARSVVPATGDRVVVGRRLAHVISYDPAERRIHYGLEYRHRDNPLTTPFTGYKLMDEETPRVWRRPEDRLDFVLRYRWAGRNEERSVTDKTRAAARVHLLRRLGVENLSQGLLPQAYVSWAQKKIAAELGKSEYDPQMIVVSLS